MHAPVRPMLITLVATSVLTALPSNAGSREPRECPAYPPAMPSVVDNGELVDLDVLVLLDGAEDALTVGRAAAVMAEVNQIYSPLEIRVVPTYQRVAFPGDADPDTQEMIAAARDHVRGKVPKGFDVVHVFTSKNLVGSAGEVACVGGVVSPQQAFGVNEEQLGQNLNVVRGVPLPVDPYGDRTARTQAHELAHQLGATHENANCTEGNLTAVPPEPCTIMDPNMGTGRAFSGANAALVRAYAVAYAG